MTATSLVAYAVPSITGAPDSLDQVSCRSRQTGDATFVVANSTLYRYDAASVGPANGTTVIKANDGETTTGFWLASVTINPAALGAADRNIAFGNAGTLDFMGGWRSDVGEFGMESRSSLGNPWRLTFYRYFIGTPGGPVEVFLGGADENGPSGIDSWGWYADFGHAWFLVDSPSAGADAAFAFVASGSTANPSRQSGTATSHPTTRYSFFSQESFGSDFEGVARSTVSQRPPTNSIDLRDTEIYEWVAFVNLGVAKFSFSTSTLGGAGVFLNRVV